MRIKLNYIHTVNLARAFTKGVLSVLRSSVPVRVGLSFQWRRFAETRNFRKNDLDASVEATIARLFWQPGHVPDDRLKTSSVTQLNLNLVDFVHFNLFSLHRRDATGMTLAVSHWNPGPASIVFPTANLFGILTCRISSDIRDATGNTFLILVCLFIWNTFLIVAKSFSNLIAYVEDMLAVTLWHPDPAPVACPTVGTLIKLNFAFWFLDLSQFR